MKKQVTTEIKLSKQDLKDIVLKALNLDIKNTTVRFTCTNEYDSLERGPGVPIFTELVVLTSTEINI